MLKRWEASQGLSVGSEPGSELWGLWVSYGRQGLHKCSGIVFHAVEGGIMLIMTEQVVGWFFGYCSARSESAGLEIEGSSFKPVTHRLYRALVLGL